MAKKAVATPVEQSVWLLAPTIARVVFNAEVSRHGDLAPIHIGYHAEWQYAAATFRWDTWCRRQAHGTSLAAYETANGFPADLRPPNCHDCVQAHRAFLDRANLVLEGKW